MKRMVIFCLFFTALSAVAYCGQASRIELADGSVVNGEVVSFIDGIYTIKTGTIGEIKVEAAKISKIESANLPALNPPIGSTQANNLTPSQIDKYKQEVMSKPGNMAIVTGLATNPAIQDMVKDPQIADAAKSGDIQSLLKNPKFMDMVNDPQFQEAVKKLKNKGGVYETSK